MASDDWERHRNTISRLFLLERLSMKDVAARMKDEHNFDKKKHQYEYQLKKWGLKKNVHRDVWQFVGHRIQKRKRLGQKSEITIFGLQLPLEKVRKELQRYTTIPTADDFARGVPSPTSPGSDIVQVRTPSTPDFDHTWPETLPWFRFLEQFPIDHLKVPEMSTVILAAGAVYFQPDTINSPAIYAEIHNLARSIPRKHQGDDEFPPSTLWANGPSAIAVESLKIILFALANKRFTPPHGFSHSRHEEKNKFILWFIDHMSKSNLGWRIGDFSSNCSTTNAILEVIWGCVIQQKRYDVITQLLKAGIDINMPVDGMFHGSGMFYHRNIRVTLKRGIISMRFRGIGEFEEFIPNALECTVIYPDIHLAKMLLDIGAKTSRCTSSFLAWTTFCLEEDDALAYAELLMDYGFESDLFLALNIAIAKHYNHLAKAWANRLHQMQRISYHFNIEEHIESHDWTWKMCLKIDWTLLHASIASGNTELTSFLLEETLAHPDLVSKKALRDLLMVACLAGDRSTIEQLINLNMDWGDGDWPGGISPLVATAWNPDIGIAEMILQAGAFSDHDIGKYPQVTISPLPIHVAARSGNTSFVKWLIGHDKGLDTQFNPPYQHEYCWLVPSNCTTPLQMALASGNVATIVECQHANLLGGELAMAVRLGDGGVVSNLLSRVHDITSISSSDTILEAAAEVGNSDIISLYFSLGGKYRSSALLKALKASMVSRDDSIVLSLIMNRPTQTIDRYEASALVIAIREKRLCLLEVLLGERFLPSSIRSIYYRHDFYGAEFPSDRNLLHWGITPMFAGFSCRATELAEIMVDAGYQARPVDLSCLESADEYTLAQFYTHFPPSQADPEWTRRLLQETTRLHMIQWSHECIRCIDNFEYYIEGETPLQRAAGCRTIRVMDLLIKAGADVNAPASRNSGTTALQITAIEGDIDIARSLLEHGADVNGPPARIRGRTALEAASEHGRLDMVQLLLENGVRLDGAMRIHYIRAVKYARNEGHYAIATLLKEFGVWTDRDQELYNRAGTLREDGYFLFNDETQDWQFRLIQDDGDDGDTVQEEVDYYETYTQGGADEDTEGGDENMEEGEDIEEGYEDTEEENEDMEGGYEDTEEENEDMEEEGEDMEAEDKDMGLLMEQYLKENFDFDFNSFETNQYGPWRGYDQNSDDV